MRSQSWSDPLFLPYMHCKRVAATPVWGIDQVSCIFKDLADSCLILCLCSKTASEIGHELAHALSYCIASFSERSFIRAASAAASQPVLK